MKKLMLMVPFVLILGACSHGSCRAQKHSEKLNKQSEETMSATSPADRVRVHKPDGSLQCGQGKAIPAAEMQKEFKDIKVYSAVTKNDGMMRIQVCGSPTGNSNVFEIDRNNLEAALKLGFKEWLAD